MAVSPAAVGAIADPALVDQGRAVHHAVAVHSDRRRRRRRRRCCWRCCWLGSRWLESDGRRRRRRRRSRRRSRSRVDGHGLGDQFLDHVDGHVKVCLQVPETPRAERTGTSRNEAGRPSAAREGFAQVAILIRQDPYPERSKSLFTPLDSDAALHAAWARRAGLIFNLPRSARVCESARADRDHWMGKVGPRHGRQGRCHNFGVYKCIFPDLGRWNIIFVLYRFVFLLRGVVSLSTLTVCRRL